MSSATCLNAHRLGSSSSKASVIIQSAWAWRSRLITSSSTVGYPKRRVRLAACYCERHDRTPASAATRSNAVAGLRSAAARSQRRSSPQRSALGPTRGKSQSSTRSPMQSSAPATEFSSPASIASVEGARSSSRAGAGRVCDSRARSSVHRLARAPTQRGGIAAHHERTR
jgi:hypothetical protein